jgi:putative ABC transport system permease protein
LAGKPHQVTYYAIEVRDPDKVDEMYAWLEETFSEEIEISLTTEFAESLPDMEASRAMINGLGVLMAMVGSIGMTNTILMSVLERTREIGVLRAVGWSRRSILGMIIKESLLLAGIGGLVGIGVGWLMLKAIGLIPTVGEMLTGANISLLLMGQAIAVALILGGLGGLYPAWRATRLSPVEALRYE